MSDGNDKRGKSSETLDVGENASTRTIKASFRRKAKLLQSGNAGVAVSKKTFQELNEAYQFLMQNRSAAQSLEKKVVTVLSSDVAEYSRMMATHEKETLEFFNFCKEVFEEIVEKWQGRVFNTAGDAILAEFDHVFNAVHCAIEIQKEIRALNLGQPEGQRILFRTGINKGEVFIQGHDLLGDTVNIAARLQTAAKPGGICFSNTVQEAIEGKTMYAITALGEKAYKNIPHPVPTFTITETETTFKIPLPDPKISVAAAVKKAAAKEYAKPGLPSVRSAGAEPPAGRGKTLAYALAAGAIVLGGIAATRLYVLGPAAVATRTTPASIPATAQSHVTFKSKPDSEVSIQLADEEPVRGKTPFEVNLNPGKYKVRFYIPAQGVQEEAVVDVQASGSQTVFRELDLDKHSAGGPAAAFAGGGAPLTPQEAADDSAGRQGDPDAAYRSGIRYRDAKDFPNAKILFSIAAKKGHRGGELELGKLYFSGSGVPKDFEAAMYWIVTAAIDGNPDATSFLRENGNQFPQEYASYIVNQRYIDAKQGGVVNRMAQQRAFLDTARDDLRSRYPQD